MLPGLLKLVDDEKIPYKAGAELSYLPVDIQSYILKNVAGIYKISLAQAQELKKLNNNGSLTAESVLTVFKKPSEDKKDKIKITLSKGLFKNYPELLKDTGKLQNLFSQFIKEYAERQGY